MQLEGKIAVIYGAGGAVGGAVSRAFARAGARIFLAGRSPASLDVVASDIASAGGMAETARVDAFDEEAVERHAAEVVAKHGKIDVSFNAVTAVSQPGTQGVPISNLSVESFTAPITLYLRSQFLTARAATHHMTSRKTGVILIHTPEPARLGAPLVGGMGPAWAAMEAFNRNLSAEFAPHGIRAVCLRSTGLPETQTIDVVFGLHAKAIGIPQDQFLAFVEGMSHRKRSTTIAEVANAAEETSNGIFRRKSVNAIAIDCVVALGALIFGLGFATTAIRTMSGTLSDSGSDPANRLYKFVRAHGNTAEYAPFLAIMILYLGGRSPALWVVLTMIAATTFRYLLVAGMIFPATLAKPSPFRVIGAVGTYVAGAALCAAMLVS